MIQEQDRLLISSGPRKGEVLLITKLPLVIGRISPSDIIIDFNGVSRLHARLSVGSKGYVIEDLGSTNGTFVNGKRIEGPCELKDGDMIGLGIYVTLMLVVAQPPEATLIGGSTQQELSLPGEEDLTLQSLNEEDRPPVVQPPRTTESQMPPSAPPVDQPLIPSQPEIKEVVVEPAQASVPDQSPPDGTMIINLSQVGLAEPSLPPPQLVVNESGQNPRIITLTTDRLRIGRAEDNDVVLHNTYVSPYHAEVVKHSDGYYLSPLPNMNNALFVDGAPITQAVRLHHGSKIRIGSWMPGEMVSLDYLSLAEDADKVFQRKIQFTTDQEMSIGRHKDNTVVLPAPTVSNYHASIEKVGKRYRVRDLRSSNGTFVNGKRITHEEWVHPGDSIQIGPYRFEVGEDTFSRSDISEGGVGLEIVGLNKWVKKNLNILQDISLVFEPKEFIVVVGQSGGGKSTLVDAINGYRPASNGHVIVNGTIDLYKEFDAIRSTIGYVPQKDIIHMELTVFQALDYAAQLRMPPDTTKEERVKRIQEVMDELDLTHRRDTQISQLSGGQQKRVSIGVELITQPVLFFLDEPTSGLDPGMETEMMHLMRRLADQGRTIVMITHATKNVMLADKVVFLARGGYLAWFGPPEEALEYFNHYRSERDRRSNPMEFDNIYTLLDQNELGQGADWAKRYREHPANTKYITEPLQKSGAISSEKKQEPRAVAKKLTQHKQVSLLRQFVILSKRNIQILKRDPFSLALLFLTAPMLASLDFLLAAGTEKNPLSFQNGSLNDVIITLIVLTNTALLVGGLAFMRELVKEREIYKRERRVNLHLSAYMLSKIWIAILLVFYQAICFTVIRYLAFDMPGGREEMLFFFITVFLLILAGAMMGFFVSALTPNANAAPLLLILFIIPQMVLSGALVSLPSAITAVSSSRWAFQGIIAIGGAGSDVAGDSCWNLTKDERDQLTLEQKNARCSCMGENALRQDKCNFPGLGEFYNTAIDQVDPVKPVDPSPQPAEPVLPEAPKQPQNLNDILALQTYLSDLNRYNEQVNQIQAEYKTKIDAWQTEQAQYKAAIEEYQPKMTELEIKRAIAVGSAEATIKRYFDEFSWTFVNKNDRANYLKTLSLTWAAQVLIISILFAGTVIMQRRHDV